MNDETLEEFDGSFCSFSWSGISVKGDLEKWDHIITLIALDNINSELNTLISKLNLWERTTQMLDIVKRLDRPNLRLIAKGPGGADIELLKFDGDDGFVRAGDFRFTDITFSLVGEGDSYE